jgi:hypothetical protein
MLVSKHLRPCGVNAWNYVYIVEMYAALVATTVDVMPGHAAARP